MNMAKRIKLAARHNWRCYWCDQATRAEMGYQNSATIEHLVPVSQGGTNSSSNLASACRRCNNVRGVKSVEEFRSLAAFLKPDIRSIDKAADEIKREKSAAFKMKQEMLAAERRKKLISEGQVDVHLSHKHRMRKNRSHVRRLIKQHVKNPYQTGTIMYNLFEKEHYVLLSKGLIPPRPTVWQKAWNKCTAWMRTTCTSVASLLTTKHNQPV